MSVKHAEFMAQCFSDHKISSAAITNDTREDDRHELLCRFREGALTFLFTVNLFNEGVDIPGINTVLFLRPTDSLTVFLQQLGRGLRHAPGKDCLTVLDFIGQANKRYRIDRKLAALLPSKRASLIDELERGFPHLPPGCSIQLEHYARQHILENIRAAYSSLKTRIPELLRGFAIESGQALTFGRFINFHSLDALEVLQRGTWSAWKSAAGFLPVPAPNEHDRVLQRALVRAAQATAPGLLEMFIELGKTLASGSWAQWPAEVQQFVHYFCWDVKGSATTFASISDAFAALVEHPTFLADLSEVAGWAHDRTTVSRCHPELPFKCMLELHGAYSNGDINAALGSATWTSPGQTGPGVLAYHGGKTYALLITFQKTEEEFSPSTMYADYPISPRLMHWQSQAATTQSSPRGQDLIHHQTRGCTILLFARVSKKNRGLTSPFTYLGPANVMPETVEGDRPITMVWQLHQPIPGELFEEGRKGG